MKTHWPCIYFLHLVVFLLEKNVFLRSHKEASCFNLLPNFLPLNIHFYISRIRSFCYNHHMSSPVCCRVYVVLPPSVQHITSVWTSTKHKLSFYTQSLSMIPVTSASHSHLTSMCLSRLTSLLPPPSSQARTAPVPRA